jgi:hypothetical protein
VNTALAADEPQSPQDPQGGTINDGSGIEGQVTWVLTGPDGKVKRSGTAFNVITDIGDQLYGERGAGIAGAPAVPTGMRLGTGSTTAGNAPAKNGTGAALTTYLTGSNQAIGTPTSAKPAAVRVITYSATFAAGKATTASAITEGVLVNDTIATDATSAVANTLSRVALSGIGSKGAQDTLTITWTHSIGT